MNNWVELLGQVNEDSEAKLIVAKAELLSAAAGRPSILRLPVAVEYVGVKIRVPQISTIFPRLLYPPTCVE